MKHKWKPWIMFVFGTALFLIGPLFFKGVTLLRPVKNSGGMVVYKTDGRMLFERDPWGDLKVNWLGWLLMLVGVVLVIVAIARMIRHKRNK